MKDLFYRSYTRQPWVGEEAKEEEDGSDIAADKVGGGRTEVNFETVCRGSNFNYSSRMINLQGCLIGV